LRNTELVHQKLVEEKRPNQTYKIEICFKKKIVRLGFHYGTVDSSGLDGSNFGTGGSVRGFLTGLSPESGVAGSCAGEFSMLGVFGTSTGPDVKTKGAASGFGSAGRHSSWIPQSSRNRGRVSQTSMSPLTGWESSTTITPAAKQQYKTAL
jgi:hypothetical protein